MNDNKVARVMVFLRDYIPNDKKLLNELEAYEAKLSPSGCMTYNARPGCKDDMIMSTAIMVDMIYNELEL